MENKEENNKIDELENSEELLSSDYYKIELSGQNIDDNINFQKWKKDMINLYGKKLILIKCSKDNIMFCVDKTKNINQYRYKCPICNRFICSYCLKPFVESFEWEDCCFRGRMRTIPHDGPEFARDIFAQWIEYLLLIPFVSFIYIIGGVLNSLFYQLLKPSKYKEYEYTQNYSDYFKDKSMITFSILFGIKVLFALSIMISYFPFVFLDGILTILILLISIPYKNPYTLYPIKYVFGMLVAFFADVILV